MVNLTAEELAACGLCTVALGGWNIDHCVACIINEFNRTLHNGYYTGNKIKCPECRIPVVNRSGDVHNATMVIRPLEERHISELHKAPTSTYQGFELRTLLAIKEAHE